MFDDYIFRKKYATHPGSSENTENHKYFFSLHIFPENLLDLPDGGDVVMYHLHAIV